MEDLLFRVAIWNSFNISSSTKFSLKNDRWYWVLKNEFWSGGCTIERALWKMLYGIGKKHTCLLCYARELGALKPLYRVAGNNFARGGASHSHWITFDNCRVHSKMIIRELNQTNYQTIMGAWMKIWIQPSIYSSWYVICNIFIQFFSVDMNMICFYSTLH